jgi:hypothetical protein
MHGAGYGALVLGGVATPRVHTVLNLGGLLDPAQAGSSSRPWGFVAGLDVDVRLGALSRGKWSIVGALATAYYLAVYGNEATVGAGVAFAPSDKLKLSLLSTTSPFATRENVAIYLGVAPSLSVF